MALASKTYPKAVGCHSPQELAQQQARAEVAEKVRQLEEQNVELVEQAARSRRWTRRLAVNAVALLFLVAGAVVVVTKYPALLVPAPAASATPISALTANPAPVKEVQIAHVKSVDGPSGEARKLTIQLPRAAALKPGSAEEAPTVHQARFLEALGGLSAAHLYQTHLNIGLLADGVESEIYTIEEADQQMKSILGLMKLVDGQLIGVSRSGIDKHDEESIRDIQAIAALLHLQTTALRGYWADGDMDQAASYHKARKAAADALTKVLGTEP